MGPDVHALHPGLPVNRLDCGSTAGCSESARRRSADSPAARADRHIPTPHIYPSIPSVSLLACTIEALQWPLLFTSKGILETCARVTTAVSRLPAFPNDSKGTKVSVVLFWVTTFLATRGEGWRGDPYHLP